MKLISNRLQIILGIGLRCSYEVLCLEDGGYCLGHLSVLLHRSSGVAPRFWQTRGQGRECHEFVDVPDGENNCQLISLCGPMLSDQIESRTHLDVT